MANIRCWILLALVGNLLSTAVARDSSLDSIFLRLFKRDNTFADFDAKNASVLLKHIDKREQLVMFIHGAGESIDNEDVKMLRDVYLKHTSANYIALDYRKAAAMIYPIAASLTLDVGKILAQILNHLVKLGLDSEKLHIIGHSLGSQVAGSIGRSVDFRIPRITGLDPAGPLFYLLKPHLTASDARFVDIIHTDAGIYGQALSDGHADFYPNFGHRPQPGCSPVETVFSENDFCSHHRSYMFYAESVKDRDAFLSVQCQNSFAFLVGICNQKDTVPMGYATPNNTRGSFYLTTNAKSPYGRGTKGLKL